MGGKGADTRAKERRLEGEDDMDAAELLRIRNNPAFQELERKRNAFSWTLAAIMLVIYGAFIFLVAFDHTIVAQPIGAGVLTLAFPLGLGVILAAIILTGVYVLRANTEFDRLTRQIVERQPAPASVAPRFAEPVR
jgi:uncharacterized membrane protein (DUF485 family)